MRTEGSWGRLAAALALLLAGCRGGGTATTAPSGPAPSAATAGERGAGGRDGDSRAAAAVFYDPGIVQTIELTIAPDDRRRMLAALPERIYVPATFRWRDVAIENAGVRFKGNSSSSPHQRFKRGYQIKFSEFVRGRRFLGLRRVALDNGIQFGSLFSEAMITAILREAGVPAPRANHARLVIDGEYQGIYVNVERIDESFLESRFGEHEGLLLKVHEGGPGADLRYQGDNPVLYARAFEPKTHRRTADLAPVVDLIRKINDTPGGEFRTWLEQNVALDDLLSTMAVLLFAGAFDQYTGWNPHNYYLYREAGNGRWHYLPWDLDVGFADNAFGRIPVIDGWNAAWPVPKSPRPLIERIVADPDLLARYRKRADRILESFFRPEQLDARLEALHARIRADLERDPFPPGRVTNPEDRAATRDGDGNGDGGGYSAVLASFRRFFRRRYETARKQLDHPGARPPRGRGGRIDGDRRSGPRGPRQPRPGPPSPDAPGELRFTGLVDGGVGLAWHDNARGERAFIVQRCSGADCDDFRNAFGVPGADRTAAVDRNVQRGATYRYRVYALLPAPAGPRGTGPSNVITVTVPE